MPRYARSCSRACRSDGARSRSPVRSNSPTRGIRPRGRRRRRSIKRSTERTRASSENLSRHRCALGAIIDTVRAGRSALDDNSPSQCSLFTTATSNRPTGQSPVTGKETSSSARIADRHPCRTADPVRQAPAPSRAQLDGAPARARQNSQRAAATVAADGDILSGHGDGPTPQDHPGDRNADLLLRLRQPVATRIEREHQRTPPPVLPEVHRPLHSHRP